MCSHVQIECPTQHLLTQQSQPSLLFYYHSVWPHSLCKKADEIQKLAEHVQKAPLVLVHELRHLAVNLSGATATSSQPRHTDSESRGKVAELVHDFLAPCLLTVLKLGASMQVLSSTWTEAPLKHQSCTLQCLHKMCLLF